MTPTELTSFLHQSIPLTQALGVRVSLALPGQIALTAPLAPNLNHHGTAFGGSLATLGILAGWLVLHHRLIEAGIDASLVVRHTELDYLQPVTADLLAQSELPEAQCSSLLDRLGRGERARITVSSRLCCNDADAVRARATYVALPRPR